VSVCSTKDGADCLHAAVKNHLPAVVDLLCQKGAVIDKFDCSGDSTLWQALTAEQFDIADILVSILSSSSANMI
jgi:ankyrin repeat protein